MKHKQREAGHAGLFAAAAVSLFLSFSGQAAAAAGAATNGARKTGDPVEGVYSYELKNGLKVLLVPAPSQPNVTVRVVYRVGSRHEGAGETGMAHLLEHMLFKGSPRHRDQMAELAERGAISNAETDADATAYYETLLGTPDNLRFALDLESDRMTAARLQPSDLAKEFSVVRNELEIGENSPAAILQQRLLRVAYSWHAYGRDVIGSKSDIENVPIDKLRAFYQKYYQPDNAVLIIAGKIDIEPTLRLVVSLFSRLPRPQRRLQPTYTVEPVQDGERSVTLRRSGDVQIVGLLYHGLPLAHKDFAASQAAIDVLSHEGSGRLYRALIETRQATNLRAEAMPQSEPGTVGFFVDVQKAQALEPVRDKLILIVEELASHPPTAAELRRFQSRARKEFARDSADPEAIAADLGRFAAAGDFRLRYLHRDRIEQLKPDDVQSFAHRYLISSNRTVGLFLPTIDPLRSPLPETPDVAALFEKSGYKGRPPPAPGEPFVATIENIEARTTRLTLPSGMKVALLPKRSRGEKVFIVLHVNAGTPQAVHRPGGAPALLGLFGPMLARGTRRHSFEQLSDELDRLSAEPMFPQPEVLRQPTLGERIELETTREHLGEVMALLSEMVQESNFPKDQLEIVRKGLLTDTEGALQDPLHLAATALLRRLYAYPADDPRYVPTLSERIGRVALVRAEDLQKFHRDYFGGAAAQLTVLGDFDAEQLKRALELHFGAWHAAHGYERLLYPYVENPGGEETINVRDKQNAVVLAGQTLGVGDQDLDYPALSLFAHILGGSDDARLKKRLREEAGAAYAVGALVESNAEDHSGVFLMYFTAAPKNVAAAGKLMEKELSDLLEHGPSVAELRNAQKGYAKIFDTELADEALLCELLNENLEHDRTLSFEKETLRRVMALSQAEFLAAVRRHIKPQRLVKITAGDFSSLDIPPNATNNTPAHLETPGAAPTAAPGPLPAKSVAP